MKKYFSLIIVIFMLFSMNGCSENSNSAVNNTLTNATFIGTGKELTNPGEYLSKLCTNVKINDTEFSMPCTLEELSKNFIIKEIEIYDTVSFDDYDVKTFNLFTKDNKYFGTVSFAFYPDGSNRVWNIDKNYLRNWYTPLERNDEHINDITYMEFYGLTTDVSTQDEVVAVLGEGNGSSEKSSDYYFISYTFEDGSIVVYFSTQNEIAVNFVIIFQ